MSPALWRTLLIQGFAEIRAEGGGQRGAEERRAAAFLAESRGDDCVSAVAGKQLPPKSLQSLQRIRWGERGGLLFCSVNIPLATRGLKL